MPRIIDPINDDPPAITVAEWERRNELKVLEHERRVAEYARHNGIECNANRVRKLEKAKSPVKGSGNRKPLIMRNNLT